MRRTALLVLVAVVAMLALVAVEARDRPRPHRSVAEDPAVVARRARDFAVAGPLAVTLSTNGEEVARARVAGNRADVAVGGLVGVQEGDRLRALGTTVEAPPTDPATLLAALVDRPARWEGRHLRLDGLPPAQAWLDADGHLTRLELDLGGGSLLAVTPVS